MLRLCCKKPHLNVDKGQGSYDEKVPMITRPPPEVVNIVVVGSHDSSLDRTCDAHLIITFYAYSDPIIMLLTGRPSPCFLISLDKI